MKNWKHTPPRMILGWVLVLVLLAVAPVSADVGDNLNGWLINFLGYGKEDSVPSDYGGSLVERMNFLEKQQQDLSAKVATKEDVENASKAANASYNLYVYIPKDVATGNYDGQPVTIISASGNQRSSAILRDDGTNYSATLYFNFSGNCNLSYNGIFNGQQYAATRGVVIDTTGKEQILLARNSLDFAHTVCSAGAANQYFSQGNVLENGWTVVNTQSNALQLWRKTNLGNNTWSGVYSVANSYWQTFNRENNTNVAYSSGFLSKNQLESGWLASNRTAGFHYWTATEYSGGYWYVRYDGSFGSGLHYDDGIGCCPAVWIK